MLLALGLTHLQFVGSGVDRCENNSHCKQPIRIDHPSNNSLFVLDPCVDSEVTVLFGLAMPPEAAADICIDDIGCVHGDLNGTSITAHQRPIYFV